MQWTKYNVLDIEEATGRRGKYVLTKTWDDVSQLFLNGKILRNVASGQHESNRKYAKKFDLSAGD